MHVTIDGLAKEGDGVGRCPDGRAIFVRGALLDEKVDVIRTEEKRKFLRGRIVSILEPNDHRVKPFCSHVQDGCGGCNLQHADAELQKQIKLRITKEAIERIGKFDAIPIKYGGRIEPVGYRTTVRCSVLDGKAGMRGFRSHDHIPLNSCGVAHERVEEIMAKSYFGEIEEVVIRTSNLTGKSLAIVSAFDRSIKTLKDVQVISPDQLRKGQSANIVEEVYGKEWRISADSFFQASPQGSELLVRTVKDIVKRNISASASMIDLYSGVGIFAGTIGSGRQVTAIEQNVSATKDSIHNLGDAVEHVCSRVEQWEISPHNFVIANPSRSGMSKRVPNIIEQTGAEFVVLISCDAAAAARDARRMVDKGFQLGEIVVLDLFPQTSHIEVISTFVR
tara:strand:- start:1194 stop:2369 length:1176 start_codon:yes stop_codon:yes gene_type:complete